jgi:hypothetical protein
MSSQNALVIGSLDIGHSDTGRKAMPDELKTGLYMCPESDEVFDLQGELPICETCLGPLDQYVPESPEAEAATPAARGPG